MNEAKQTFWFDPTKWLQKGELSDGENCCVIGQFLVNVCGRTTKSINNNDNDTYLLFEKLVGKQCTQFYGVNDNKEYSEEEKLGKFKELFSDTPYNFKVKGIDE